MLFFQNAKDLQKFKNIHKGEQCFILGTGPSLNQTPLELLKDKIVFGTNNCHAINCVHFSYFTVVDEFVFANQKHEITDFVGTNIPTFISDHIPQTPDHFFKVRRLGFVNENKCHFWGNIEAGFNRGHTVILFALQIAYYMGFQEAYLLGCDCSYGNVHHFDGTKVDNFLRQDWSEVFACYEKAKNYYSNDGRSIFNATVGGKLEVFPRVDIKEVQ